MLVLIGAESLLRGLKKDELGRRKKGDPRRVLVTRINMSHVLHAGLAPKNSAFPKEKTSQYKFVDDIIDAPDKKIDDMPLTANTLGKQLCKLHIWLWTAIRIRFPTWPAIRSIEPKHRS
jgi:hypothetical protein